MLNESHVTLDAAERDVLTLKLVVGTSIPARSDQPSRSTGLYLDSDSGEAKGSENSLGSIRGKRSRGPKLAPDLGLADLALERLLRVDAHAFVLARVSLTGAADVTLEAVRRAMRDVAHGLAGGAWLAVDVREDGAPHVYGVVAYRRGELRPMLDRVRSALGARRVGQLLDAVTGWERYAELGDAGALRTNLASAFAYGAKPWPVGVRNPSLDFVASGAFAGMPLASHLPAHLASVTRRACLGCGVTLDVPSRSRRLTCSTKCRQRKCQAEKRKKRRLDRERLSLADVVTADRDTCGECFGDRNAPDGCDCASTSRDRPTSLAQRNALFDESASVTPGQSISRSAPFDVASLCERSKASVFVSPPCAKWRSTGFGSMTDAIQSPSSFSGPSAGSKVTTNSRRSHVTSQLVPLSPFRCGPFTSIFDMRPSLSRSAPGEGASVRVTERAPPGIAAKTETPSRGAEHDRPEPAGAAASPGPADVPSSTAPPSSPDLSRAGDAAAPAGDVAIRATGRDHGTIAECKDRHA